MEADRARLYRDIMRLQHRIGHSMGQYEPGPWMDLNLTIAQLKSLFFIDFERSTNFRKLASAMGVSPPNVTGIIDRLVEQGLVSREENPEDRRVLLLKTTEKGKALLARLRESRMSRMSTMLARLRTEELSILAQGLAALARATEVKQGEPDNEHSRS